MNHNFEKLRSDLILWMIFKFNFVFHHDQIVLQTFLTGYFNITPSVSKIDRVVWMNSII